MCGAFNPLPLGDLWRFLNIQLGGDRSAEEPDHAHRGWDRCGSTKFTWGCSCLLEVLSGALRFMLANMWKLMSAFAPHYLFIKYKLVFLPVWEVLRSEGEEVWRESHVLFDPFRRHYFCCLACNNQGPLWNGVLGNVSSVPYWYLDYGKRADLKFDISILYLVKVI